MMNNFNKVKEVHETPYGSRLHTNSTISHELNTHTMSKHHAAGLSSSIATKRNTTSSSLPIFNETTHDRIHGTTTHNLHHHSSSSIPIHHPHRQQRNSNGSSSIMMTNNTATATTTTAATAAAARLHSHHTSSSSPPKRSLSHISSLGSGYGQGGDAHYHASQRSPKSPKQSPSQTTRRNITLLAAKKHYNQHNYDDDDDDNDSNSNSNDDNDSNDDDADNEDSSSINSNINTTTKKSDNQNVTEKVSDRLKDMRLARSSLSSDTTTRTTTKSPSKASTFPLRKSLSSSSNCNSSKLNSQVESNGNEKYRRLRGLRNLGNTCFMNSCLQCLSHTVQFSRSFLLDSDSNNNINSYSYRNSSPHKGSVAKAFAEVMSNLYMTTNGSSSASSSAYSPSTFKSIMNVAAPYFKGRAQHDAHEFLRMLLDALHEDTNRIEGKPVYKEIKDIQGEEEENKSSRLWEYYTSHSSSIVTDTFCGQLQSSVECSRCHTVWTAYDAMWDLSLQLPAKKEKNFGLGKKKGASSLESDSSPTTLYDCLESFTQEEILDGNESYYCAKCKKHCQATKTLKLCKFPKVLVVHLKRFSGASFRREKLSTLIDFPLYGLDLEEYIVDDYGVDVPLYDLFGVSNHIGGMYGGHYTAFCKSVSDNNWYNFDDSAVRKINESDIVSNSGYVLFYLAREES